MRKLTGCLAAFVLAAFFVAFVGAQSGRVDSGADGKRNQRKQAAASPSPTPTPEPIQSQAVNTPPNDDDGDVIKVNTQIVSVPVRVMDKNGRFIGGLGQERFKVLEDGVEQEIASFSSEQEPFTIVLVLDVSYSIKISDIQSAAIAFIDQLRPQDKVSVISFAGDVHFLCEPTNDRKAIYTAIRSTKVEEGTSIYDAMDLVMNDRLRKIEGRKAAIVFSDGVDTSSLRSNDLSNLSDAQELDALIYTIRYDTYAAVQAMKNSKLPPISVPRQPGQTGMGIPDILGSIGTPSSKGTTPEEYQKAAEYLRSLSDLTGGRPYDANSLTNLAAAYSKIASELREFYSISYYPKQERSAGKRTNVKVKVDVPGAVVRARETFIRRKKT